MATHEDGGMTGEYEVRGSRVELTNTRPDIDSREVLDRLGRALDLIALHAPRRFRRLHQDIQALLSVGSPAAGHSSRTPESAWLS